MVSDEGGAGRARRVARRTDGCGVGKRPSVWPRGISRELARDARRGRGGPGAPRGRRARDAAPTSIIPNFLSPAIVRRGGGRRVNAPGRRRWGASVR